MISIGRVDLPRVGSMRARSGSRGIDARVGSRVAGVYDDLRLDGLRLEGHRGEVVPVVWADDAHLTGWYQVDDVEQDVLRAVADAGALDYDVSLVRVGRGAEIQWESRLVGSARANGHGLTAELWHAPPAVHSSWWADTASPAVVTRALADGGSIDVYRDIPSDADPLWRVDEGDWYGGAAAVELGGVPMPGSAVDLGASDWSLSNGLVRIGPHATDPTLLTVGGWDGTAWDEQDFRFTYAVTTVPGWLSPTVLRNDPAAVVVRLVADEAARTVLDIGLVRGSRTLALRLHHYTSATLGCEAPTATSSAISTWGILGAATGSGNRWVLGSPDGAVSQQIASDRISLAAATDFDMLLGWEVAGAGAQAGDTAADLVDQYLGAPQERTKAVAA